ncbi:amino acid permease [Candidatus Woesearchaeota archaeon]|nr:amino acid permease [Candidatus Woesearchaeota archaeon]
MSENLEKSLSFPVILIITINSIMGTGIFFLPSVGVREAGPASIISWCILSLVAIYISMIFAELTSMFPTAGGVYEFCKQAYGRFFSFIIGWMTILAGNITIAMLIVGTIQYLLPLKGSLLLFNLLIDAKYIKLTICILFIFIFNYIAFKGIKTSATMLVAFGIITLGTLFGLIIPGLFSFSASNFMPFAPYPVISIAVAIFLIAETFFGWETATFLAAETKDGKRVMPKALIIGTIVISVVSVLFLVTSIGTIPWQLFGESQTPLIDLGLIHYGSIGQSIFIILVYLSIIGSVAGWVVSAPRLLLAMAEDKLLLSHFQRIHKKHKTPHIAILFQTILTTIIIIIGFGSYQYLLHLLVPIVLAMYSAVVISVIILRKKLPNHQRCFVVPFAYIGCPLVILFLLGITVMWALSQSGALLTLEFALSLILLSIPVFFLIELYYDPKMIKKVNDQLAYFTLLFEKVSIPKKVINEILYLLGDVKSKNVLEYGCNVGTLTIYLSKAVGTSGRIIATDISKTGVHITQRRVERALIKAKTAEHGRVHLIHDEEHANRIHPDVKKIDAIVSIGAISFVQDIKKVLKEMYELLPDEGRIVIVEYVDYIGFIPNVEWLDKNLTIEDLFLECGFSVRVIRKEGLFWNYIYIYGIKFSDDIVPYI